MSVPALVTRHVAAIEAALRAAIESRTDQIYRMMEYQLGWVDEQGMPLSAAPERLRATLCLGACEALGGDPARALPAAAAVELLHEFTRVHEDIQSGAPERDNRPSGWWLWGPAQAINVGDALHMVARLVILHAEGVDPEQTLEWVMVMDAAALDLFEGQQRGIRLDLEPAARPLEYLAMAERQPGALLGCALQMGAVAAGADQAAQDACRDAGRQMGVEMRLQNDLQTLRAASSGGPASGVGRSFPVLVAIESGPVAVKREIGGLLMARAPGRTEAARMAELVEGAGAVQATAMAIDLARTRRLTALERAGMTTEEQDGIIEAADYLTGAGDLPF